MTSASPIQGGLGEWLQHQLKPVLHSNDPCQRAQLQVRQRGNVVYLLCEGVTAPARTAILPRLTQALAQATAQANLPRRLSAEGAQVHRLVVYGRSSGQTKPDWAETLELTAEQQTQTLSYESIAHHLSRQLSPFNIAVRVRRKVGALGEGRSPLSRLYIICESTYAPDANVIAAPLAQALRDLALRDCQDALISGQATGESEPEWLLRVDLTPADQLLRQRAKWGDTKALARLLKPLVSSIAQSVQVTQDQSTLHIALRHAQVSPAQSQAVRCIEKFLVELAPQGIVGASLYGILTPAQGIESQTWLHWLDLPAAQQIELATPVLDLAARGSLEAIGHLLTQALNPNLDQQLATGGIRVQVRQRGDILHVMTEAVICPNTKAVTAVVLETLPQLQIADLSGLCIYGRQAGHPHASWRQGTQLGGVQKRFVPASTPEFASAEHIEDLMSPPGALIFVPRRKPRDWGKAFATVQTVLRSVLLTTPIFTPSSINQRSLIPTRDDRVSGPVGVIWGLLGLCLMVSGDWALGFMLKAQTPQPEASAIAKTTAPTALPALSLNKSGIPGDPNTFNASGFTDKKAAARILTSLPTPAPIPSAIGNPASSDKSAPSKGQEADLPSAPLMPKAQVTAAQSPYPRLNAAQLDERLALYQQYVDQFGVPDVLIVGSSRALRGIDPSALQDLLSQEGVAGSRVFNFGINGATAQTVDLLLRRLIAPQQLPKMIVWADGARAFNSGRTDVTYNAIVTSEGYRKLPPAPIAAVPSSKPSKDNTPPLESPPKPLPETIREGYQSLDRQFQDWLKSVSAVGGERDLLLGVLRDRLFGSPATPSTENPSIESSLPVGEGSMGGVDIYGFLPLGVQFNPATYYQKYSKVSGAFDSDYDNFQLQGQQQEATKSIAQLIQSQGKQLVFVNLPMTTDYLDSRRREHEQAFQTWMIQAAQRSKFTYRDLSTTLAQQNALFSDPSHLNRYGAYEVSQRLARDPLIPWTIDDRKGNPSPASPSATHPSATQGNSVKDLKKY